MDRVPVDKVAVSIAVLADLSLRTAQFLMQHVAKPRRSNLDVRVRDTLRQRFRLGRQHFIFQGHRRQHRFDFGITMDGKTVLVEAVTPEIGAINSAIVKSMDARNAAEGEAWLPPKQ